MAMTVAAVLLTSIMQAKTGIEAASLNNGVSKTLLCVLGAFEKLLEDMDEKSKCDNAKELEELDSIVQEILKATAGLANRQVKMSPYSRLCRVLCSRSTYMKLQGLLQRFNVVVTTLHLCTTIQAQTREQIQRETDDLESRKQKAFGEDANLTTAIITEIRSLEENKSVSLFQTSVVSTANAIETPEVSPYNASHRDDLKGQSIALIFEGAKRVLQDSNLECGVLDELTVVMLFYDECEEASIPFEEIQLGKILGQGGFGIVREAQWNKNPVAVKVIDSGLSSRELSVGSMTEFANELAIWKRLVHPNIVPLLGTSYDKSENVLCFVMELCLKSLSDAIHNETKTFEINTSVIQSIGKDVACGLEYLHGELIVHRDLKPKNVLLVAGVGVLKAKLCDFGMALAKQETTTRKTYGANIRGGTLAYMAPEVLTSQPFLTTKSDIFSFGVLLWELLERRVPFAELSAPAILSHTLVNAQRLEYTRNPSVEDWVYDILEWCWNQERSLRPTAKELVCAFENKKASPIVVEPGERAEPAPGNRPIHDPPPKRVSEVVSKS